MKTSEEQAEAKRLEREQKLKLYQSATQAVFQKRQAGELDESVLELTSQILGANPDFATLWNCRREVFQQLETQKYVVVQVSALALVWVQNWKRTGVAGIEIG